MGLRFESAAYLLLLIPAAVYVVWVWRSTERLRGGRRAAVATLRALVVLLLILALAGLQSFVATERKAVVFVADRSDSMAVEASLEAWIRQASAFKADEDAVGVISAALKPVVERGVAETPPDRFSFAGVVEPGFTDLDRALQLAASMLPDDAAPRVVLLSDGRENVGDALRQGRLLRDRGIPVDVLPLPSETRTDASVDALRLPSRLYQAEQYALEVAVTSTFAGAAELRVYEDNREIAVRRVQLEPGANRFALQGLAASVGLHRYRAELYANEDEVAANNAASAFSRVSGPPKVLLVEGGDGETANAANALDAGLVPYDVVQPEMLPQELSDYAAYESIVLANVSATRLSERQMEMIELAVRDYGVGLVMTGGDNSYGLGGYFQTPIERALPVYMDLRGKREMPSLAMALVIDKSGSMAGEPIELAKEAAGRTAELLREADTIGVLAFDSAPWWVVEPAKLSDREDVLRRIGSISADGGTEIYTAVEEAFRSLKDVDAQRKHIILLTDGQSATNQSYEALAEEMKGAGVSLSSVAIGDGADTTLLERIASLAGGRYYFANDSTTIPAIFSREAAMISRTYIVDRPFVPAIGQAADWQPLFAGGLPEVKAYVATTPKETAETALASPEPDPLLARWQYGAGRAVAWTSDLSGRWAGDWVAWSRFPDVFSRIVKWSFPQFESSAMELASRLEGNEATLTVTSRVAAVRGDVAAVLTNESLEQRRVELEPAAPGEFIGRTGPLAPGAYLTRIESAGDEGETIGETTGFVVPYSPEYAIGGEDGGAKLQRLAELTGGRTLDLARPEEVFAGDAPPKLRYRELWRELTVAALLLWVVDIAVRRLHIPWDRLLRRFRRQTAHASGPAAAPAAIERLRRRVADDRAPAGAISPNRARLNGDAAPRSAASQNAPAQEAPGSPSKAAPSAAPPSAPSPSEASAPTNASEDRMNRLLAARRRRGR